ncbi:hypothetical protein PsYK624_129900 [Phanerochaete sordida]|uniref:F-box domain-containing protein n=1 Tax=Phanerochaete sordida TaxID=48140 RepID=A0A9P3GNU4_9APHY|nr:hypothetical protein PsYK624_129900 [Phanerochaete sordida]
MSRLPTGRLPPELCDLVIDFLATLPTGDGDDTVQALARCSRVCRSWLPRASSHLLRGVEVNWAMAHAAPDERDDRGCWHHAEDPSDGPNWHDMPMFLADLDASPRLRQHVRAVTVRLHCEGGDILRLFAALSGLEQLVFVVLDVFAAAREPPASRLLFQGTVHMRLCDPQAMESALALFSEVQHLRIDRVMSPNRVYSHLEPCYCTITTKSDVTCHTGFPLTPPIIFSRFMGVLESCRINGNSGACPIWS